MSWERPFEPESSGTGGGGSGVSDHGALTGLADDDHPLYLTQAEADALYKTLGYIPSWAEITGKPSTFPPSTHNHDTAYAALGHVGSRDGHPVATTTLDGLMVGADKAKLDDMAQSIISPLNGTAPIGSYPIGSTGFYYTPTQTGWPDYPGFVRTLKTSSTEAFQILTDIYGESERARSWDSAAVAWRGWTVVNSGNFASVLHGHNAATAGGASGFMTGTQAEKLGSMASPAMASCSAKSGTVLVNGVVKEVQLQAPTILSGDITYDAVTSKLLVGSTGKYLCGFFVLFVSGTTADGAVLFSRIHVDAGSNTIGASHTGSASTFGTSSSALLSLSAGQRVLPAGFWFGGGSPEVSTASIFYMLKVGV